MSSRFSLETERLLLRAAELLGDAVVVYAIDRETA